MQKHNPPGPRGIPHPRKGGLKQNTPYLESVLGNKNRCPNSSHCAKGRNWLKVLYFRPPFGGCGMPLGGRAFACKLHLGYTFLIADKKGVPLYSIKS